MLPPLSSPRPSPERYLRHQRILDELHRLSRKLEISEGRWQELHDKALEQPGDMEQMESELYRLILNEVGAKSPSTYIRIDHLLGP